MPKERLHLLLADLTLKHMSSHGDLVSVDDRWRLAFLHGAMAPDLLFYDVPSFRWSSSGRRLHSILESSPSQAISPALLGFLQTADGIRHRPWLLGMAHHFLVDFRWHPLINGYAAMEDSPCRSMALGRMDCHHWLESELEAWWLDRLGPGDGYLTFLRQVRGDEAFRRQMVQGYAALITDLGIRPSPSPAAIHRCSLKQVISTLEFSRLLWGRFKEALLSRRVTQHLGALIVPRFPNEKAAVLDKTHPAGIHRLWEPELVEETVEAALRAVLSLPGRTG